MRSGQDIRESLPPDDRQKGLCRGCGHNSHEQLHKAVAFDAQLFAVERKTFQGVRETFSLATPIAAYSSEELCAESSE